MAELHFLRKDDEESDRRKRTALEVLDRVADGVRNNRLRGMVVVAFEDSDAPEMEATVHRYYLSGGVVDMLTTLGLVRVVADEISEGTRLAVDME